MSQYFVNFEDATKTLYSAGLRTLNGVEWMLDEAVIGTSVSDKKNDLKSLRLRGSTSLQALAEMRANKIDGLGTLSFYYARYSTNTLQPNLYVEYSTNNGSSWTTITTIPTPFPDNLTLWSRPVNIDGNVRVRFRTDLTGGGTSSRMINIDDVLLTDGGPAPQYINVSGAGFGPINGTYEYDGNSIYYLMPFGSYEIHRNPNGTWWFDGAYNPDGNWWNSNTAAGTPVGLTYTTTSTDLGAPPIVAEGPSDISSTSSSSSSQSSSSMSSSSKSSSSSSLSSSSLSSSSLSSSSVSSTSVSSQSSPSSLSSPSSSSSESSESSSESSQSSQSSSSKSSSSQSSQSSSSLSSQSSSSLSSQSSISSQSSSSEIKSRILPFTIRGVSWGASGKINGHLAAVSYRSLLSSSSEPSIPFYQNKISQTEKILLNNYKLDRIALYLGQRRGIDTNYNLVIEIYEADENGKPDVFVKSVSRPASEFSDEGWYFFDIAIPTRTKPPEDMICVVFYQDGGSDLNCVPWYYSDDNSSGLSNKRICHISSDELVWEEIPDQSMTMKLINSVDMFSEAYIDTPEHRINTSPGDQATLSLLGEEYLENGIPESHNVKLISEDDSDNEDSSLRPYVSIDHPKIVTSLVIDGSGSMGWNDRRTGRLEVAKSIKNLLLNTYPGEAVLDVVRIGATRVEGLSFESSQTYNTIKVDLFKPDATTLNADGSSPSLSDGIMAYGFRNLEVDLSNPHTYIIAEISSDKIILEDGDGLVDQELGVKRPLNVNGFGDWINKATFQIDGLGPGSEDGGAGDDSLVAVLNGNTNHIRRNIQVKRYLATTGLTSDAESGDPYVEVESSTNLKKGMGIDVFDANGADTNKIIDSITGNRVFLVDDLFLDIGKQESEFGGLVQEGVAGKAIDLTSQTTLELLVKDARVTRNITFYLQTEKGGRFEWSIRPFSEWSPLLLFYSDKGGSLSLQGFDTENVPLPDGTEVQLFIDNPSSDFAAKVEGAIVNQILNAPLQIPTDQIELANISGIKVGDSVSLLGENPETQTLSGYLVDSIDFEKNILTVFPPVDDDSFDIVGIETKPPAEDESESQDKVFLPISAVDLTPSYLNLDANPSVRLPYDPIPTDKNNIDKNIYNLDETREVKLPIDLPSMWNSSDKKAVISLRVLPITEDYLDQESDKEKKVVAATKKLLSTKDKILIEALEEDYRTDAEEAGQTLPDISNYETDKFTVSEQEVPEDADYSIETPVLLFGGKADSFMQTFTKEMELLSEDKIDGHAESYSRYGGLENWEMSGLLGKEYKVYPYILLKDNAGGIIAVKAVEDFTVTFASPYQIWSNIGPSNKKISFTCLCKDPEAGPGEEVYTETEVFVPGWYAASNETMTIDYVVTERGRLLKDGELKVRIFDAHRSKDNIADPSSYTPDFETEICSCDPEFDINVQREPIYYRRDKTTDPTYLESLEFQEATYLENYTGEFSIPIVNGRASVTVKAPKNVVAKLMVMAELVFPDNKQFVVKTDPVWFASPLSLKYIGQNSYLSGDSQPLYEIGAKVLYMGQPAPDNIAVEFLSSSHARFLPGQGANVLASDDPMASTINQIQTGISEQGKFPGQDRISDVLDNAIADYGNWKPTPISPGVSKTRGYGTSQAGTARDVFLGTHGEVVMHKTSYGDGEEGDFEILTIKTSYLGFDTSIKKRIEWVGKTELYNFKFYLRLYDDTGFEYISGRIPLFADGWRSVYVLADLSEGANYDTEPFIDPLLGSDIYGNPVGLGVPRAVQFTSGGGLKTFTETAPIHPITGALLGDNVVTPDNKRGFALSNAISRAMVIEPTKCDCAPMSCCEPQCSIINAFTSVRLGEKTYLGEGCGCLDFNACSYIDPCASEPFLTSIAIDWTEPLQGKIEKFGTNEFIVNRNGTHTEIIVDISFSGEPIPVVAKRHNVTDSSGIPIGMPIVSFDIYKVVEDKDPSGKVVRTRIVRDDSITLSKYSDAVSVELTTPQISQQEPHFHGCQVDDNGNGKTTTMYENGTGKEISVTHEHTIVNYVVSDSTNSFDEVHSHTVRSVARTKINPTTDNLSQICIEATVSYDASKKAIDRTITIRECSAADELEDTWILKLMAPGRYNVQESVANNDDGMDILAEVQHMVNGYPVAIPDGYRIHFNVEAFLPKEEGSGIPGSSRNTIMFPANEDRKYVNLVWKATIQGNNEAVEAEAKTEVYSEFSWLPSSRALVPEITSDEIYLDKALSSITTLGGSPIHDAVYLASSRVINHRIENSDWNDCFSCVVLLTDGDENLSDRTLSQGIKSIQRSAGQGESSGACVAIGTPHPADLLILKKYAEETNGALVRASEAVIDGPAIAKKILSEKLLEANLGVYQNHVDLSSKKLFKSSTIELYLPTGCFATFRACFGEDGKNWLDWSESVDIPISGLVNIEELSDGQPHRFMKYEISLYGNDTFESPRLLSVSNSYIEPKKHLLLFTPISLDISGDDYVGEVLITHKITNPANSTISYGVVHADSSYENDYFSEAQPLTETATRHILLGRHNELATANDQRTFWLVNGSWPKISEIEVYKVVDGVETFVSPSLYSSNPEQGTITFASMQGDNVRLSVSVKFSSMIRIACLITNYGEESVSIDHIGLTYNTVQRIERDESGINRKPISDIYDLSSSSSSSSEIEGLN